MFGTNQVVKTYNLNYQVLNPILHFSSQQQVETYTNNSDLQWNAALKIINLYGFRGNENVIDFACGNGKVTDYLRQKTTGHVLGFDISREMIEKASQTYLHNQLLFKIGDITNFFSEKKYELAHAGYCLHYVDASQALTCLFDVLSPRGTALMTLPGRFNESLAAYADIVSKSDYWAHFFDGFQNQRKYYSSEEFKVLLDHAGFIPHHVETRIEKIEFPSREAICDFYLPASAHARFLVGERKHEFINDLINLVLAQNKCQDDPHPFIYQCTLEAIALKPNGFNEFH